jgi:GMP synthase (glutamine-hydrolysing)
MMKPILIIKTGSTAPELIARRGDFEDWIIKGTGLENGRFLIVNVEEGGILPSHDQISASIITGSHAMLTDHLPWMESTAQWLAEAMSFPIPTLGICFGHQLLAYALGGEVAYNPSGPEYGSVELKLTHKSHADLLLKQVPVHSKVFVSHAQTVIRLPEDTLHLAFSEKDNHQAFCFNHIAWGVQFHPEFDADIVRTYIGLGREALLKQGSDPDALLADCQDTELGSALLHRFVEIVASN